MLLYPGNNQVSERQAQDFYRAFIEVTAEENIDQQLGETHDSPKRDSTKNDGIDQFACQGGGH